MASRRFVVVSGLPGCGKSTLAGQLSPMVGLPVLDKDDYLEALFSPGPIVEAERSRLSRKADQAFIDAAIASQGAILVSFWRRPELSPSTGTPTDWLASLGQLVELHCVCPPGVAVDRFFARVRHPAHGDGRWQDYDDAVNRFTTRARLGPLNVGPVVTADTASEVDLGQVAAEIGATLGNR